MEQYQQTATGTARHALQLPEDDPDDKIVDLILEDEDDPEYSLMIGDLIRRERHADVYSVYWYADACWDEVSEARAFVLDGVPRKLKWHRKRCIQRLSPRTWCEASCRGAKVIIYKINNNTSVVTPEEEDTDSSKTSQSVLVPMKKTNYKREAARIRQRERRRQKASQGNSSDPQDVELIEDNVSLSEDLEDTFRAAILLYVFFDKKGNKRSVKVRDVPISCRRSLELVNLFSLLLVHESPPSKFADTHQTPNADDWLRHEILQHLEVLKLRFSKMSYRELFTGVHSALSTLSSSDLGCVPSTNHRFDLLQHIQATLPKLIDDFQTTVVEQDLKNLTLS